MAVDYSTLKKGGFMRQKQKLFFSSIGSRRRKLNRREFETIAEVADKYGDGHVHLTSRQSVEIPFIKLDDIDAVKKIWQRAAVSRVCADHVFVRLLPVREIRFVQAATLTHMILQKLMRDISPENFLISLNSV